jgi:hypothetical protein
MEAALGFPESEHPFGECPDRILHRNPDGGPGILLHGGGKSSIAIDFCPWCGRNLAPPGPLDLEKLQSTW